MNTHLINEPLFQDSRLILSAGTLVRATFVERVSAAEQAGFDAISLFPQQYLAASRRENLSIANMQEILAEHGVDLDEVDPLLDWFSPDATHSETVMMEMAEALGARSVNVAAAFVSDRPFQELVDCYGRVCERVACYGLRADLEFLPWTRLGNLTQALELVDAVNQPNAGVMFDFWHFFNSGESLDVLRQLTPQHAARITSLQLNDVPGKIDDLSRAQNWAYMKELFQSAFDSIRVLGMDAFLNVAIKTKYPHPAAQKMMKDAMCSRLFPGEGAMPVAEVLAILSERGVAPAIGVEVFSLEHHTLGAADIAQRAMKAYEAVLLQHVEYRQQDQ
jgi:sugar phosphate isomerase/epimerase